MTGCRTPSNREGNIYVRPEQTAPDAAFKEEYESRQTPAINKVCFIVIIII